VQPERKLSSGKAQEKTDDKLEAARNALLIEESLRKRKKVAAANNGKGKIYLISLRS